MIPKILGVNGHFILRVQGESDQGFCCYNTVQGNSGLHPTCLTSQLSLSLFLSLTHSRTRFTCFLAVMASLSSHPHWLLVVPASPTNFPRDLFFYFLRWWKVHQFPTLSLRENFSSILRVALAKSSAILFPAPTCIGLHVQTAAIKREERCVKVE